MRGYGCTPHFVEGDDPAEMHPKMAATLERCLAEIRDIQGKARAAGKASRARWPMIVLRTPKGWTGPAEVDGHRVEGFWRAHQVPLTGVREDPKRLAQLEAGLQFLAPEILEYQVSGRIATRRGNRGDDAVPQGAYPCAGEQQ